MFREAKTAQMAAYLLRRDGGQMNYTKLMKLLYLADRESMRQTGDSMTHDRFYSMEYGPVLSQTLNMVREAPGAQWGRLIEKRGYNVCLTDSARTLNDDDLDELSKANRRILDQLWDQFGPMFWKDVVKWTHDNCEEWQDPRKSSHAIPTADVFKALGFSDDQSQDMAKDYEERRRLDRVMERLS